MSYANWVRYVADDVNVTLELALTVLGVNQLALDHVVELCLACAISAYMLSVFLDQHQY